MSERIIAVVDDDFRVTESLENLFASAGFVVCAFESAEAFLASEYTDRLSCLISDIEMPGMKGEDLVKTVRSRNAKLPIVLISGHRERMEEAIYTKVGANAFFPKPFNAAALVEKVKDLLQ
jgi:FixJ family two-component response regulator